MMMNSTVTDTDVHSVLSPTAPNDYDSLLRQMIIWDLNFQYSESIIESTEPAKRGSAINQQ